MKNFLPFFGRLFSRSGTGVVRFRSGRFTTRAWSLSGTVAFYRPLRGAVNEFCHSEIDDVVLAVEQAYEWGKYGIKPLDRAHLSQRGRTIRPDLRKRGTGWIANRPFRNILICVRPVRSFWTMRLRYMVAFFALLEDGDPLTYFPSSHIEALLCATRLAREFFYGGQAECKGSTGSNVIDLQSHPRWRSRR